MKTSIWILGLILCVTCVCVGAYMAINGITGWGWFLFLAVLLAPSYQGGN